jgi:hypothetical protein
MTDIDMLVLYDKLLTQFDTTIGELYLEFSSNGVHTLDIWTNDILIASFKGDRFLIHEEYNGPSNVLLHVQVLNAFIYNVTNLFLDDDVDELDEDDY